MLVMVEEVLFESEQSSTRGEIADYLRSVAERLAQGESITLKAGSQELSMDPPERATFEVKAEREGPPDGPGELSIEFEIEWDENGNGGDLEVA